MRRMSHVRGGGREGEDRPGSRQAPAVREAGETAARQVRPNVDRRSERVCTEGLSEGRDAEYVQVAADGSAQGARRLSDQEEELNLPDDFPRDVEAVACDLDRTLIGEDALLHPRTRLAIERTREAGVHVILVTGRMFQSVRRYALEAGLDDPVVCYQGAVVAEPQSGRWLRHVPIPLELAREAIAALNEEGFGLNCYVDDELYVAEITPEARRYAEFQHLTLNP